MSSAKVGGWQWMPRSEEHTSELQSRENLVCRLLLEKKKKQPRTRRRRRVPVRPRVQADQRATAQRARPAQYSTITATAPTRNGSLADECDKYGHYTRYKPSPKLSCPPTRDFARSQPIALPQPKCTDEGKQRKELRLPRLFCPIQSRG